MPTPASRDRVLVMIAAGFSQEEAGAVIGISKPTLARHYKRELRHSYASITARIAARLIAMADAGDERAIEFFLERRGGWVLPRGNVAVASADAKPFNLTISYRKPDPAPDPA